MSRLSELFPAEFGVEIDVIDDRMQIELLEQDFMTLYSKGVAAFASMAENSSSLLGNVWKYIDGFSELEPTHTKVEFAGVGLVLVTGLAEQLGALANKDDTVVIPGSLDYDLATLALSSMIIGDSVELQEFGAELFGRVQLPLPLQIAATMPEGSLNFDPVEAFTTGVAIAAAMFSVRQGMYEIINVGNTADESALRERESDPTIIAEFPEGTSAEPAHISFDEGMEMYGLYADPMTRLAVFTLPAALVVDETLGTEQSAELSSRLIPDMLKTYLQRGGVGVDQATFSQMHDEAMNAFGVTLVAFLRQAHGKLVKGMTPEGHFKLDVNEQVTANDIRSSLAAIHSPQATDIANFELGKTIASIMHGSHAGLDKQHLIAAGTGAYLACGFISALGQYAD